MAVKFGLLLVVMFAIGVLAYPTPEENSEGVEPLLKIFRRAADPAPYNPYGGHGGHGGYQWHGGHQWHGGYHPSHGWHGGHNPHGGYPGHGNRWGHH